VSQHRQGPGIRPAETGQAGDQRRLAGTVRAEQTEELALGDLQRNAGKCLQRGEALLDAIDGNRNAHGMCGVEANSPVQASGSSSETP
jgi:hypothetical protein